MLNVLIFCALIGGARGQPASLPVAPFDIGVGHQVVDLRQPLIARSAGASMVLFVRDATPPASFEAAHPKGSVTAHVRDGDGHEITLVHTGYNYYKGYSGLVLTEQEPGQGAASFLGFELDAKVSLKDVRVVWLDRPGLRVEDLRPPL